MDTNLGLGVLLGFLSGSLPFGYLAGKLKGIDIRQHGSGNIGATNAIRVLGKGVGIPVFALDFLKGLVPCVVVSGWMREVPVMAASTVLVATGLAAILGHMFTPWLGFKGGKGVATAAGVLAGVAMAAMLVGLGVWLALFYGTRYVSLASMTSGVAVALTLGVGMALRGEWDLVMLGFGVLMAVLVVVRHRANIGRLLAGTEPRSGGKRG